MLNLNGIITGCPILWGQFTFPAPLPSNIGQVLKDALKDEIVYTTTGLFIEEKINETRKTCND